MTYSRLYSAESEMLQFTSGGAGGIRELHVINFTYSAIEIYDVTNPTAPLAVTNVTILPVTTGHPYFEAVFRTDNRGERKFVDHMNMETPLASSA